MPHKSNGLYSWLIGIGLVLLAVHNPNQPLLAYTFLPVIGIALIIPVVMLVIYDNRHELTLGSRWVYIPVIILALSVAASGNQEVVNVFMGAIMFGLYICARVLGQRLFKPFAIAVIIETISLMVAGVANIGVKTGGIISPTNYDIATGLLIFGLVVSSVKHQWWLSSVALVGLYFTGASEAIFCVVVLAIAILVRRDISIKMLLPTMLISITLLFTYTFDIPQGLYDNTASVMLPAPAQANTQSSILVEVRELRTPEKKTFEITDKYTFEDKLDYLTNFRYYDCKEVLFSIKPFGRGYIMTEFYEGIPHNVPLIIVNQVGILGGLAWLVVMFYLLMKSRRKYLIVAIIALGVFDHFIWTQVGIWWWAAIGIASLNDIKSDLVFREVKTAQDIVMEKYKHIVSVANGDIIS